MNHLVRTFIAVELNEEIRQVIRQAQERFKPLGCDIAWVKPENIHLTLKFLGDVKSKMIEPLADTLTQACRDIRPVRTELTQLGVFPDLRRPRILWAGLNDTEGRLTELATAVEDALGHIGFKKETRPFQSHITIGRIRSPRKLDALSDAMKNYELPSGLTEHINHITLYKSVLTSTGPVYTILSKFALQ